MKRKKIMSLILSAIMLVTAVPGLVLAEGDDPDPDTLTEDQDGQGDSDYIADLTEGVALTVESIEEYGSGTFSFTPSSSGRYGFLCADGRDISVSVTDAQGETVSPLEIEHQFRYEIQYFNLQAGKEYSFHFQANDYSSSDVIFYIGPMQEFLSEGQSALFVKGYDYDASYTFIPERSAQYTFVFSGRDPLSYPSLRLYGETVDCASSGGDTAMLTAYLEAGKPYDINLYATRQNIFCSLVNVEIFEDDQTLFERKNEVLFKADNQVSFYSFTPTSDDVYVFYSTGEVDTEGSLIKEGYDNGEGKNFKFGVSLRGGERYFVKLYQNGDTETTVPVYVEKASAIAEGQEYNFPATAQTYYIFSFTPAESGWYNFETGTVSRSLYVYDSDNRYISGGSDSWYLSADKTYLIEFQFNDSSATEANLMVQKIANELSMDADTVLTTYSNRNSVFISTFIPSESGVYVFTSEQYISKIVINNLSGQYKSQSTSGGKLDYTVSLVAGTPYLITFGAYNPSEEYKVTVRKNEEPLSLGTLNTLTMPSRTSKQYTFTPDETGYYFVYSIEGLRDAPYVYGGENSISLESGYSGSSFFCRLTYLEQGQTYMVQIKNDLYQEQQVSWAMQKAGELTTEGSNTIDTIGLYAYYTYTPSVSGVYTFTSDVLGSSDSAYIKSFAKSSSSYFSIYVRANYKQTTLTNSLSAVLEEGQTYVLCVKLKSTVTATSFPMTVVKEQALETYENQVAIVDRNSIVSDEKNGICSFTADEDALYVFASHADRDYDPMITIYDDSHTKIAEDDSSGDYYNFRVEVQMEAGKTYFLDIYDYLDYEYELPVTVEKVELQEARLDGYSLSLDGSIAVNLYMSLSDSVVNSETAVLNFTSADGNVITYDMQYARDNATEYAGKMYYVFHLPVAAKEMTADLQAQIVDEASGFAGRTYTFSVRDYAEYILNNIYEEYDNTVVKNPDYLDAAPLVKALLNYGTCAQNYFGFDEENPANANMYSSDKTIKNVPTGLLPLYNKADTSLPDGVTFVGASLSVESETALSLYFDVPSGMKLTFTDVNGKTLSQRKSGSYTVVTIKGIPAHKLGEYVTVNIAAEGDAGQYSIAYSPMTYCYNVLTRSLSETRTQELKDLMKAFYYLNQAAVQYMGE